MAVTKMWEYGTPAELEALVAMHGLAREAYDWPDDYLHSARSGIEIEKREELLCRIQEACAEHPPLVVIEHMMESRPFVQDLTLDWDDFPESRYWAHRLWDEIMIMLAHASVGKKAPSAERITHVQQKCFLFHLICRSRQRVAQLCQVSESAVSQSLGTALRKLGVYLLRKLAEESPSQEGPGQVLPRAVSSSGWGLVREAICDCLTDEWRSFPEEIFPNSPQTPLTDRQTT